MSTELNTEEIPDSRPADDFVTDGFCPQMSVALKQIHALLRLTLNHIWQLEGIPMLTQGQHCAKTHTGSPQLSAEPSGVGS